jgi:ABC-2 type transport system ATP-binding protein
MPAAIETEGLTKDYLVGFWRPRPHRALDALTLSVEAGEVFGFLGPNGAGKSTTLKLLMQLIYPTSGSARILGRPVGDLDVKKRIGFLAENPYYYDYLTAEEVLAYFARLFGYSGADVTSRVAKVLDDVGIPNYRKTKLRALSKGNLQRVGLAQALLNEPELIFLDEPMSGLDPIGRSQVRDLILKLRQRGCTVFFSSHILSDAESLCSRVGIMAQGRLVASGRVSEMIAFELKGWELLVSGLSDEVSQRLQGRVRSITPLKHGRFTLDLAPSAEPETLIAELRAAGADLVSLNPVRETLEEYFVKQVTAAQPRGAAAADARHQSSR